MSDLRYLAISKNRGKKGITSVFILIQDTQNEESFLPEKFCLGKIEKSFI